MNNTIFGFDADTLRAFDAAYLASLPPALQALMMMNPANATDGTNPRLIKAGQLALQGYVVDVPIMAWGWGAYQTMYQRQVDGLATVSDGLGQVKIKVSINPADFTPYPKPPVDPSAQYIDRPIGGVAYVGAGWFPTKLTVEQDLPDGTELVYDDHEFVLHVTQQQGFPSGNAPKIYVWIQQT